MPLPPQNLQRQLFYFEGALVRHLESPQALQELKAAAATWTRSRQIRSLMRRFRSKRTRYGSGFLAGLNLFFEPPCDSVQRCNVMRPAFECSHHRNNQKDERRR